VHDAEPAVHADGETRQPHVSLEDPVRPIERGVQHVGRAPLPLDF